MKCSFKRKIIIDHLLFILGEALFVLLSFPPSHVVVKLSSSVNEASLMRNFSFFTHKMTMLFALRFKIWNNFSSSGFIFGSSSPARICFRRCFHRLSYIYPLHLRLSVLQCDIRGMLCRNSIKQHPLLLPHGVSPPPPLLLLLWWCLPFVNSPVA